MFAEGRVIGDVVDDDRDPALPDLVADGRLKIELATGLEAEGDVVLDGAGDPAVLGDTCDGGEAHARGATDHIEDRGHGRDAFNRDDVVEETLWEWWS
ncbi:hypothetical protein J2W79_003077 [Methylorubrum extorquens]|nr:hypothetical protein [Methylorubrum extorquens]